MSDQNKTPSTVPASTPAAMPGKDAPKPGETKVADPKVGEASKS